MSLLLRNRAAILLLMLNILLSLRESVSLFQLCQPI